MRFIVVKMDYEQTIFHNLSIALLCFVLGGRYTQRMIQTLTAIYLAQVHYWSYNDFTS